MKFNHLFLRQTVSSAVALYNRKVNLDLNSIKCNNEEDYLLQYNAM
jgi:hypothetical protein